MDEAQKTGYEQYGGIPKDPNEWSTKAIAELVSLGYEMSDQGEPMYEAYALGMVAIISELQVITASLSKMAQAQAALIDQLTSQQKEEKGDHKHAAS